MFNRLTVSRRLAVGFGLILAILAGVAIVAMWQVRTIDRALRANSELHTQIQRHAINFRGSAHDRAIAVRDVALSTDEASRRKEVAAIGELAAFYARSAQPLEQLLKSPDAAPELAGLYAGIQSIEAQAVATTQRVVTLVGQGDLSLIHI